MFDSRLLFDLVASSGRGHSFQLARVRWSRLRASISIDISLACSRPSPDPLALSLVRSGVALENSRSQRDDSGGVAIAIEPSSSQAACRLHEAGERRATRTIDIYIARGEESEQRARAEEGPRAASIAGRWLGCRSPLDATRRLIMNRDRALLDDLELDSERCTWHAAFRCSRLASPLPVAL